VLSLALGLGGCAREFINQPLVEHSSNGEILHPPQHEPAYVDEPFIVMSFSGGGVRATALAYAVLTELDKLTDRAGHRLTDDVRLISSASGGSVAAAWFGLTGRDGLTDLREEFLTVDNMTPLELQALNPVTWVRLAGPSFSRIDVLREYLDARLFGGRTFADLYARPGAPIVVLNATDMSSGEVFSFTPDRFDDLCSNLAELPVSAGVAASAAFPIALTPVSLKNWTSDACRVNPRPQWIESAVTRPFNRYGNLARYKSSLEAERVRNRTVRYRHLLDGGLADNLGTTAALAALFGSDTFLTQLPRLNADKIRSLVAIEVNARSDPPNPIDIDPSTPGVPSVLGSVIGNPIGSATRGNAALFMDTIAGLKRDGRARRVGSHDPSIPDRIYAIQIDFDQFDSRDPEQVVLRDRVKQVPTAWTMSPIALQDIEAAARRLLEQHPCFVRLREDLAGAPRSPFGNFCDEDSSGRT
jgi:NTE family protein